MQSVIPGETIERSIYLLRGQKVMLDSELAKLYGVTTGNLNKAVKRNIDRFPSDFMFQLTDKEWEILIFQSGISKEKTGGRRFNPYVFTEQGVAMLSSVLSSEKAVHVNIQIMRAFVRMREMLQSHEELHQRLEEMEQRYDAQFAVVFEAIRELMMPPEPERGRIGFRVDGAD